MEKATFGAGCFWGVEAAFRAIEGVHDTAVGYLGGTLENPTYHDVCNGDTGHAEVVEVDFDPAVVSYQQLLDVFWNTHNPTTLNRQGVDFGSQYRSAIFFHSPEQEAIARASKAAQPPRGVFKRPVVTEITPLQPSIALKSTTNSTSKSAVRRAATFKRSFEIENRFRVLRERFSILAPGCRLARHEPRLLIRRQE